METQGRDVGRPFALRRVDDSTFCLVTDGEMLILIVFAASCSLCLEGNLRFHCGRSLCLPLVARNGEVSARRKCCEMSFELSLVIW